MSQFKISKFCLQLFIAAVILTCHMDAYASSAADLKNDGLGAPAAYSSSSPSSLSTAATPVSSASSSVVDPTPYKEARKNLAGFSQALEAAFQEARKRDSMSQLAHLESQAKQQGKRYDAQHFADPIRAQQQLENRPTTTSNSEEFEKMLKVLANLKASENNLEGIEPIGIFNLLVLKDLTTVRENPGVRCVRQDLGVSDHRNVAYSPLFDSVIQSKKTGAEVCIQATLLKAFIEIINENVLYLDDNSFWTRSERISNAELLVTLQVAETHRKKIQMYFMDLIEGKISPCAPEGLILSDKFSLEDCARICRIC